MIKITNEVDGRIYKLVPSHHLCDGCNLIIKCENANRETRPAYQGSFSHKRVCEALNGIWKDINYEKTKI